MNNTGFSLGNMVNSNNMPTTGSMVNSNNMSMIGNMSISNYISSMCFDSSFSNMCKDNLMEHLQFVSFAIDDLRLFLDTHPCNKDALFMITELMKIRQNIFHTYTSKYGPIYSYNINTDNGWTWNKGCMPWNNCSNCSNCTNCSNHSNCNNNGGEN